jgi:hypothetical protein
MYSTYIWHEKTMFCTLVHYSMFQYQVQILVILMEITTWYALQNNLFAWAIKYEDLVD